MEFLNKPENICNPLQVWDFVTMCPSSPKRPRRTYDEQELDQLETVFAKNPYPDRDHRAALAQQMKVSPKNIQIWFQNRRARERFLKRKAEGIVDNPIDRMRFQLINLPPNTFKSEFAHNVQMCQNPPQSSTESGSITHFSEAFEDTNVKITTSSPPDPSCHHHHHQFSENRFPLQTITSIQNISQSNTERRVVNSKDNHYTRLTAMDHQVNVMPRDNNFENTHIPFPQQYPENIGEKSSTLKPSTPGYRLSLNSVSNLSDISNSSFSDLISVMENDGEKVESTTIHFSPNSDVIFDF